MCRSYKITNTCQHFRIQNVPCHPGDYCEHPTPVEIRVTHFCSLCGANPHSYKNLDPADLDLERLLAVEGIAEICKRATELFEREIPIPGDPSLPLPFEGRITKLDLEVLDSVECFLERVLIVKVGADAKAKQNLTRWLRVHNAVCNSIERAFIDNMEDTFFAFECALEENDARISALASRKYPPLCRVVDVMDLAKDDRECPICLDKYIAGEDEDRIEEKPVKLVCDHVFGKRCLATLIATSEGPNLVCPFCRKEYRRDKFLLDPIEAVSPWWMQLIRGETIAQDTHGANQHPVDPTDGFDAMEE